MKIIQSAAVMLCVCLFIIACKDSVNGTDESRNAEYRLSAYNSLSDGDKSSIISDWQNAPVTYGVYASNQYGGPAILPEGNSSPVSYITPLSRTFPEGTPLAMVTFNTSIDALLGPIVVILLAEDATPIGFFGRL